VQVKTGMLGEKCIAIQALLMLLYLLGCAPQTYMLGSGDRPLTPTPQISSDEAVFTADHHQTTDLERLSFPMAKARVCSETSSVSVIHAYRTAVWGSRHHILTFRHF
jgi:hypothetical protein